MLLTSMEQRPKVVRDIVLTRVVLYNMLRGHQGGGHLHQRMTFKHHNLTRWSRDRIKTLETHRGRPNINNLGALAGQEDRI